MTKEQEESIEYLKKHIKYFEEQIKFIEATDCDYYDEELELYQNRVKQFKTVLSMLEEKDKEIDKLKKHNDDLLRKLRNRVKEVKKLKKYSLYKEEFSRLNQQLQSKDKIIDLMANHIATSDSDLCEYLDITNKCKYYAGDNGKTCDSCIKQYFENKAKESE